LGESLVGQAALEKNRILLTDVPYGYVKVSSGLGESRPMNIVILPILFEGEVKAVMELSSLERFNSMHQAFLDQLAESIGIVLNTIEANTRTEDLLKQSQSLAAELQRGQKELQKPTRNWRKRHALISRKTDSLPRSVTNCALLLLRCLRLPSHSKMSRRCRRIFTNRYK